MSPWDNAKAVDLNEESLLNMLVKLQMLKAPPVEGHILRGLARDYILPGFMLAGSGHDCGLMWAEIGVLNGICHDKHFVQAIAYIEEFDPATGRLKEDKLELVTARLNDFKYIINSEMKAYMLPAMSKAQLDGMMRLSRDAEMFASEPGTLSKKKPDIMAITRGMC